MRVPSGTTDQVIYFVGVDATDLKTRETGLSSFTVYRDRNGAGAAAMTTPTVTEVDSSNMPGVYKLLLDEDMTIGAGNDSEEMVFHITHAGMAPVTRTIELYRPKITVGVTLGVESDGDLTKVNTLDGHTAQTGDAFARLGAPAGASVSADVAAVKAETAGIIDDTDLIDDGTSGLAKIATDVAAILVDTGTTLDALIDAIKAKTDQLDFTGTASALKSESTNMRGTDGANTTAPLDAAGTRTAVGLAAANLDTQLDAVPTRTEATADKDEILAVLGTPADTDLATDIANIEAGGGGGDATEAKQDTIITHLTDVKGATFSGATDSLEAIRNRGDAAWVTGGLGAGSVEFTYTVTHEGSPLAQCKVEVHTNAAMTNLVAGGFTDAFGAIVFSLDPGTYYFKRIKYPYTFANPDTEVVSE